MAHVRPKKWGGHSRPYAAALGAVLYIDDGIVAFSALELAAGDPIAQVREDISKAGLTINACA